MAEDDAAPVRGECPDTGVSGAAASTGTIKTTGTGAGGAGRSAIATSAAVCAVTTSKAAAHTVAAHGAEPRADTRYNPSVAGASNRCMKAAKGLVTGAGPG